MDRQLISLLLTPVLIGQVFTINLHPAVSQYLQLAGLATPAQPVVKSLPAPKPSPAAPFQTIAALASLLANPPCPKSNQIHVLEPKPSQILSLQPAEFAKSVAPTILSSLPTELSKSLPPSAISTLSEYLNAFAKPQAPVPPSSASLSSLESLYSSFPTLDPSFLNSLVLAIQLLLLTNILNTSSEVAMETKAPTYQYEKESPPQAFSYAQAVPSNSQPSTSQYYPYYESQAYSMPNANFVGTSSFMDSNPIMSSISYPSSSRNGLALMSPYEALGPSSPYSDPILSSSYGSTMNLKRDFQSPYMAILASEPKESFSFNDLFS